ncbi:hypothetical protein [Fischerella sp. PCC 9605]|uniref:hypothetical protein n=1 Tax=Fischerella sp. PCC 9605 TaxID=1173024 RepID=UPI0004B31AEB|nr:hypothetical protein [Fischerella sp. PCC 9605]
MFLSIVETKLWLGRTFALTGEQAFVARQDQIISQDIAVVESQRPRRLPLDLQAEVHLPSDRYCVA